MVRTRIVVPAWLRVWTRIGLISLCITIIGLAAKTTELRRKAGIVALVAASLILMWCCYDCHRIIVARDHAGCGASYRFFFDALSVAALTAFSIYASVWDMDWRRGEVSTDPGKVEEGRRFEMATICVSMGTAVISLGSSVYAFYEMRVRRWEGEERRDIHLAPIQRV
ncbi:hypothetical protein NM208_g7307 [Fusarium decemcellulare]|uniref:Uncharacterized protein n=1 Tax=Fusarium decemcellulare TaxID=57161 RepID=A0ACC1S9W3_9HYPO|nr:hypothetical protein NM208_g7307 [Fusarium decemcellulare]